MKNFLTFRVFFLHSCYLFGKSLCYNIGRPPGLEELTYFILRSPILAIA